MGPGHAQVICPPLTLLPAALRALGPRDVALRLHIPTTPLVPPPTGLVQHTRMNEGDITIGPLRPGKGAGVYAWRGVMVAGGGVACAPARGPRPASANPHTHGSRQQPSVLLLYKRIYRHPDSHPPTHPPTYPHAHPPTLPTRSPPTRPHTHVPTSLSSPVPRPAGTYLPLTAVLGGSLFLKPLGFQEASRDVVRLSPRIPDMLGQQGYISCDPEPLGEEEAPLHVAMQASPAKASLRGRGGDGCVGGGGGGVTDWSVGCLDWGGA